MKYPLILILIISLYSSLVGETCREYMPDESIDECLGKETDRAHFGCCGISLTQADSNTHEACISVPNIQAGKGLFSEIEKIVGKDSEAKFNLNVQKQMIKLKELVKISKKYLLMMSKNV